MILRTIKRRTTTNLKTKNNQSCQKIELYGKPTTKELKKKHSSRPIGRAEMGSRAERIHGKVVAGGPGRARGQLAELGIPHSSADKLGGTTEERDRQHSPGFQPKEVKPQNF